MIARDRDHGSLRRRRRGVAGPLAAAAGQHDAADDRDHEQHRGDLERPDEVGEQALRERLDVAGARGRRARPRVECAPVTQWLPRRARRCRRTSSTPSTIAAGRWNGLGSSSDSCLSTPSSVITNRNSTTIALAYTTIWIAATSAGVELQEQDRDADERHEQEQRRVHRVAREHDAERAGEHRGRADEEDDALPSVARARLVEVRARRRRRDGTDRVWPRSGGRTPKPSSPDQPTRPS